ncbi:MAG: tRNA (N6-threonylcarbamoyladenosine(37)-N6)-methyltransferase TrmO [Desulfobacterales bacterium]|nr:tRNA (N6-threonylcarbamoyladenosine(37)-N6)-methyltransferase TrmO [Desulfobacterales bacterium]
MFSYEPIGIIHSPFNTPEGMPIQPAGAKDIRGSVEVDDKYEDGLGDIEGFSHIILVYHFHLVTGFDLKVTPFIDDQPHGLFSTRAPRRPNPIGLSVVRLVLREGNTLQIEGVDVLDGTPLLDIKPFSPEFDCPESARTGWMEKAKGKVQEKKADDRFK